MSEPDEIPPTPPIAVPANISVTLTQEKSESTGTDWERTARIASLVAIPVVLAIIGAFIQAALSRSTVSRDYVQLAVSVLTADKTKTPPELRSWAVDLLNENSPVRFSKEVADRLKGGEIEFPGSLAAMLSTANGSGGMAVSPDGKSVAIPQGAEIRVWDLTSGRQLLSLRGHTAPVISIAFSPDAHTLASGSDDHTVRLWDLQTGRQKSVLQGPTDAVVGVAFTPDGHLLTRSLDGTVSFWDANTGMLLRKLQLKQ
jgi:WD domain, G-beta repeat